MPKLKTKSSAKKRFRLTAKGKDKMPQSGKDMGWLKEQIHKLENRGGQQLCQSKIQKLLSHTCLTA